LPQHPARANDKSHKIAPKRIGILENYERRPL